MILPIQGATTAAAKQAPSHELHVRHRQLG